MSRIGTPMQALRDRDRKAVPAERIEFYRARGLEVAAEDAAEAVVSAAAASTTATAASTGVTNLANGTTAFTGLKVGSQNVKPFLDLTDGSKLTAAAGLGSNVVTTVKVLAGAVTPAYSAYTAGAVLWTAELTEKTVQTVAVTVVRGSVRITGLVDVVSGVMTAAAAYGTLRLKRDGVALTNAERIVFASGGAGTWQLPGQVMLDFTESPGAGSYSYTITFQPSEVNSGQVLRRSLIALPLEG